MTVKLEAQWIVGFVDGEGCFNLDVHLNQTCRWKVQIQPEFTVVQGEIDVQVLHAMKEYFGCGSVSVNRKDSISTRMMYRVKNIDDLLNKILPFFEKHQLKTKKNVEFKRFREIVIKIKEGYHKVNLKQFLEVVKLGKDLRVISFLEEGNPKDYRSEKLKAQLKSLTEECQKNPDCK